MQIRPFQPGDAERLAVIFYRAVRETALRAYSERQVEAWAPGVPLSSAYLERVEEGHIVLVAVDDDGAPAAYAEFELSGHIYHFYCLPEHVGTGLASKLYDALERAAREHGVARLYVEASELARPMFERKHFHLLRRNDFHHRGIDIHNYIMEKRLT